MNNLFDSGLDYQPLIKIGLTREQAQKMVAVVMPLVQLKLQAKVEAVLGSEKMIALKAEADKQKLDFVASLDLIDGAYRGKTGEYLMEQMRLLINEHLKLMVKVITQAKTDEAKFTQSGLVGQFEKLLDEGKADEAAKILEKGLKDA